MLRRTLIIASFAASLVLCAPAPTLTPEKIQRIERAVAAAMARSTIPGVSAAIGLESTVAWQNGFGLADLENMVPVTSNTAIRLGSISKPITAVAVLQLVEKGRIRLDAPIQDYVPQFPPKQWPVSVRQLLGHLGGVRHYQADEIASTRHYLDSVGPLEIFARDPLLHEPGSKYSYSTYGFNLLGAAVELVGGLKLPAYLAENVFKPAGTEAIRDDDTYAVIPHRSRGYALRGDGQIINCGLADTSNKIAGGGLIGPASDLVRIALAVNDGKLLRPGTVETMFTSQMTNEGKPTGYGMGWRVGIADGRRFASHGGGQQGTTTFLLLFPEHRAALAVMMNRELADAERLVNSLAGILFE